MDEKLLPYFENVNDGGEQGKYLKEFGNEEEIDKLYELI